MAIQRESRQSRRVSAISWRMSRTNQTVTARLQSAAIRLLHLGLLSHARPVPND
jgi:hypothetical protein